MSIAHGFLLPFVLVASCGPGDHPERKVREANIRPEAGAPAPSPTRPATPTTTPRSRHEVDVNGDGFADIAVTEWSGISRASRVVVFFGSKTPRRDVHDLELGAPRGQPFGSGIVSSAGDLDADGTTDLLVADRVVDPAGGHTLVAYVYRGGPSGPPRLPSATLQLPNGDADHAGFTGAGDVDGDGYSDVVASVACPPPSWPVLMRDPRDCTPGLIGLYVYRGGPTGVETTPSIRHELDWDAVPYTQPRTLAMPIGDVNADGYADLLVGPAVYLGSASGPPALPSLSLLPARGTDMWIHSVTAGDFDGDGASDLLVAASENITAKVDRHVYAGGRVLRARPTTSSRTTKWLPNSVGDVTGDGASDAVDTIHAGDRAGLVAGGTSGLAPAATQFVPHPASSVGSPGDLDGDGIRDLVLESADRSAHPEVELPIHVVRGGTPGTFGLPIRTLRSTVERGAGTVFAIAVGLP